MSEKPFACHLCDYGFAQRSNSNTNIPVEHLDGINKQTDRPLAINDYSEDLFKHCLILDKKLSNALDMPENLYTNSMILAEIDNNTDWVIYP